MKHLTLSILGLLLVAGTLHAQVAVPSMVPSRPEVYDPFGLPPDASFTPENPAAMQWGTPSEVGYGGLESAVDDKQSSSGSNPYDFRGAYGGLRWVGERFSLGAEEIHVKDREPDFDMKQSAQSLALAFRYDDGLAFGFETGRNEEQHYFPAAPIPPPDAEEGKNKVDRTTIGVSFRMWERLFLGIAQTRETWKIDFIQPPPIPPAPNHIEQSRVVEKYGVGLRAGTTYRIHAEYYIVNKEALKGAPGDKHQEEDRQVGVLEFKLWNLLVAGRATTINLLRDRTPSHEDKVKYDIMAVDYGWAPDEGPAIMVHLSRTKMHEDIHDTLPSPQSVTNRQETKSAAASLTWMF